jgi:hypothetical protein
VVSEARQVVRDRPLRVDNGAVALPSATGNFRPEAAIEIAAKGAFGFFSPQLWSRQWSRAERTHAIWSMQTPVVPLDCVSAIRISHHPLAATPELPADPCSQKKYEAPRNQIGYAGNCNRYALGKIGTKV